MRTFQLINATSTPEVSSIKFTEDLLFADRTIPFADVKKALHLQRGKRMKIHYGEASGTESILVRIS